MDRDVELAIRVATETRDAVAGMGDVGDAAKRAADDVDRASKDAGNALETIEGGADGAASNLSTLAGAFGDVAAGLGLIGLGGFSDELEAAAPALMLVAGAADITAVATKTLSLAKIKDTAATVANKTAQIASSAATKAAAAAQWALNAAMAANPITLVVLAVVALVAGFVLLYKRSETFRNLVQKVGEVGRRAIGWIVDKVGDLVGWVKDKAPAAWNKFREIAVKAFNAIPIVWLIRKLPELIGWVREKAPAAWNVFKDIAVRAFNAIPIVWLIRKAGDLVGWVKDRLPDGFRRAKEIAVDMLDKITAPVDWLIDKIQDLIGWIGDIDWPSPPDWLSDLGGILSSAPGGGISSPRGPSSPQAGGSTRSIVINISGAIDPIATARQIRDLLTRYDVTFGELAP